MDVFKVHKNPDSPAFSLRLLKRISLHLDVLAGHVFDIEQTVGDTVASNASHDDLAIRNLQTLDFLRQSLEDMALLAALLSKQNEESFDEKTIELIGRQLKLESTRCLLEFGAIKELQSNEDSRGELDLL
ncbi:hypothetical protein ROLI_022130 [Roseobacter fucihabitans]|uniref:Uncharacterized protein n=1 Tax=Roseobacter fucihabitans TaxID=1537242 RepID=A0ABZ2BT61_9RHOB|nr:hypothetical protein [Roseobacter litoralis]MBC6966798.1 hypothetical protein [Roseobacter litoralis]